MHVEDLWFLFRSMHPLTDWNWLDGIMLRLRGICDMSSLKPRAGVNAVQIFDWAKSRLKAVSALGGTPDLDRAVQFRDGLMVGLLIAVPLRVRTYTAIRCGQHLLPVGNGFMLAFKPLDLKDKRYHDYPVPVVLYDALQQYLDVYRPALLQGLNSDYLLISRRGAPLGIDSFTGHLADLTRREFGETLRPHAFRHVAATTIVSLDPEFYGCTADVLGHSTLEMATKYYNHATSIHATTSCQEVVRDLKTGARQRERAQKALATLRSVRST